MNIHVVNENATRVAVTMASNEASWRSTLQAMNEKLSETTTALEVMEQSRRQLEMALEVERSQKEELNTAMRGELKRYTDDVTEMEAMHIAAMTRLSAERDAFCAREKEAADGNKALAAQVTNMTAAHEDAVKKLEDALTSAQNDIQRLNHIAQDALEDNERWKGQCDALEAHVETEALARRQAQDKWNAKWHELEDLGATVLHVSLVRRTSERTFNDMIGHV
jgi:chromosome segregation ATPase